MTPDGCEVIIAWWSVEYSNILNNLSTIHATHPSQPNHFDKCSFILIYIDVVPYKNSLPSKSDWWVHNTSNVLTIPTFTCIFLQLLLPRMHAQGVKWSSLSFILSFCRQKKIVRWHEPGLLSISEALKTLLTYFQCTCTCYWVDSLPLAAISAVFLLSGQILFTAMSYTHKLYAMCSLDHWTHPSFSELKNSAVGDSTRSSLRQGSKCAWGMSCITRTF